MLFRRQIQIGLVKGSKNSDVQESPSMDREEIELLAKTIGIDTAAIILQVMVGYMALDTIRKIAINRLSK